MGCWMVRPLGPYQFAILLGRAPVVLLGPLLLGAPLLRPLAGFFPGLLVLVGVAHVGHLLASLPFQETSTRIFAA